MIHYSTHERPDMTLDKLQNIAASIVLPVYKSRWLSWWNAEELNRKALKFPVPIATEDKLKLWLPKATFWAEVKFLLILIRFCNQFTLTTQNSLFMYLICSHVIYIVFFISFGHFINDHLMF